MAESLRGGLSLCMSGFGFWSHDIAGFESTATPDLYKRWAAFGLLSSHSRLHGNMSYRVPWLFDEEAVDVLRDFTKLKCKLMPYLFNMAIESTKYGTPVMRAMVLEFEEDANCNYLDTQYMLGDSLLVAPVFNSDSKVKYYLPAGIWTNYLTNEKVTGGVWRNEIHDYRSIPLMVRPNSIIAIGECDNKTDYNYLNNLELHIFEFADNISISKVIYDNYAKNQIGISIEKNNNVLSIHVSNAKSSCSIVLRGIYNVQSVDNGKGVKEENGTRIVPEIINEKVLIYLDEISNSQ
jgi:alpha-D-xyloside xylohydrolase